MDKRVRAFSKAQAARRALWLSLMIVGFGIGVGAQQEERHNGGGARCEASPAVARSLETISADDDASLTSAARKEKQLSALRPLLARHPDDLFAHKRFQDVARRGMDVDLEDLVGRYKTHLEKHPHDPIYHYLYGRLLVGRRTPEARANLERALQLDPTFAWAHLSLAEVHSVARYKDKPKAGESVRAFWRLCPSSLSPEAFWSAMNSVDDQPFLRDLAQKLRVRLAGGTDMKELALYDTLWQLEFRAHPVPDHARVRAQIETDLKRLRRTNLESDKKWFETLRAGFKLTNDKEGMRRAEDQIVARFPRSSLAKSVVQERWRAENPYPDWGGPPEKSEAYYAELMRATGEWIVRWPADAWIRSQRFDAATGLKDTTLAEVEAAADAMLKALEEDPDSFYSTPPTPVHVARVYLKRNTRLDRIAELVRRGFEEMGERAESDKQSDWSPPGEKDYAQENLRFTYWTGWPILAETYLKTGEPTKAREVLRQMGAALGEQKPDEKAEAGEKLGHQRHEAVYWEWMGRLAEHENRRLDALAYYQSALSLRPPPPVKPAKQEKGESDDLADRTQRLWKELGGTAEGWANLNMRGEASKRIAEAGGGGLWEQKEKALPDFELFDLKGRTWRLGDLKGKVAFINLWATWCGPCQQELPYVQKLHELMRDRKDVVVLTLNVDQEVGAVEPYVAERKFTFPVLPAASYVDGVLASVSIPRNWVISPDGTLRREQIGFGNKGDEWLDKAREMIRQAGAAK